jgi:hypothetical protein
MEVFDGAAIEAFGLGLVAEEGGVEFGVETAEAFAEVIVAILGGIGRSVEVLPEAGEGIAGGREGLIEEAGEEGGFDAGETFHGLLREGDAFDGLLLLRVDGAIAAQGVGAKLGIRVAVFHQDDVEAFGAEAVFAGVLCGTGFALGSFGAGGMAGIGSIGRALLVGCGHGSSTEVVARARAMSRRQNG